MDRRAGTLRNQHPGRKHAAVRTVVIGTLLVLLCAVAAPAQSPTPTEQTLYSFCAAGAPCPDGNWTTAGLVQAPDGSFWGTTPEGGAFGSNSFGTIFKVKSDGTFTTVYNFCSQSGCSDGAVPGAGLTLGGDGNFYGTTTQGGEINAAGSVYRITPSGGFTNLYTFCNYVTSGACLDGSDPRAGVIRDANGDLFGTTYEGGANGRGTVFELIPGTTLPWTEKVLYNFCSQTNCADGKQPSGELAIGPDGTLYGTTSAGGSTGYGTVFSLTPASGGQYTFATLHSFCPANSSCPDGGGPRGSLVLTGGYIYGVTQSLPVAGTIFKVAPDGTGFSVVYSFCPTIGNCVDGEEPTGLTLGSDGNLYGSTNTGGTSTNADYDGTIFRVAPDGTFTSLYDFTNACGQTLGCGSDPASPPIFAKDGNLYGTTYEGGITTQQPIGFGTVYRILLPIPVPNVVGLAQATAESDITGAGLAVGSITQQTSPTVAAGDVISQSPPAGTQVSSGTAVDLTVSTGVGQATSLAISFSPDPGTADASETVTATITTSAATVGGTVSFTSKLNNTLSTLCAQAQVAKVAGTWQATCNFTPAGTGTYAIDAAYSGDPVNAASSNSANLTVNAGNTPVLDFTADSAAVAINANNAPALTFNAVLNSDSSVSLLENGTLLSGQGCAAFTGLSGSVGKGSVFVDAANSRIYLAMFVYDVGLYLSYESLGSQGNCTPGPLLKLNAQSLGQPAVEMNVDPAQGLMYVLVGYGGGIQDALFVVPTAPWSATSLPVPAQLTLDYSAQYGPIVIDPSNHQVYIDDLGNSGTGGQGDSATAGFFVYDPSHSATPANNLQHVVGYISNGTTAALNVSTLLDNGQGKLVLINANPSANTASLKTPITILDTTQFSFFTNTQPGTASNSINITPGGGLSTMAAVTSYGAIGAADIDTGHSVVYAYAFYPYNSSQPGLLLEYNLTPGASPVETVLNSSMAMPQMYSYQGPWTRLNYDPKSTEIALAADQNGAAGALGVTSPLCSGNPALSQLIGSQGNPSSISFPVVNDVSGYIYAINAGSSFPASPAGIDSIAPPAGCPAANLITPTVDVAVNGATKFPTGTNISGTVTVTGGTGKPTPTGTVSLSGGGYGPVTMTLTNGSANFSIPAWTLAAGNSITLTAAYTPDTNSTSTYLGATGTSAALVVETSTPTVTVQPASSSIGTLQSLSVTIAVGAGPGSPTAAGTVILTSANSSNAAINYTSPVTALSNGSATIDIPGGALTAGNDTLTAAYTPTGSSLSFYTSAAGSATSPVIVSAPATIQVNDPELVTASDTPQVPLGVVSEPEDVTVTDIAVVTVSRLYTIGGALSGLANGESITLLDNGGDAVTVGANGSFAFATGLISGSSYRVTVGSQPAGQSCVVNNGSGTVAAANISSVSVICETDTATTLTISPSPSTFGQPVTFTGTVVPKVGNGTPGGTVTFACPNYAPGQSVNSGPISMKGGVAVWTTSALPAFSYSSCFTAAYSGDANYLPSASPGEGLTVTDFQFDVAPPAILILLPGQSTTFTFQVGTAFGPFMGTIDFAMTGLPSNVTATFNPQTVTLGSSPVTVTVTLTAAQLAKLQQPGSGPKRALPFALALLFPILWPLLTLGRARRRLRRGGSYLLLVLLSVAVVFGISACGGNGFFNQPPQTYTATIIAKSGTAQHSTSLMVTVE